VRMVQFTGYLGESYMARGNRRKIRLFSRFGRDRRPRIGFSDFGRLLAVDRSPLDIESEAINARVDAGERSGRVGWGVGVRASERHSRLVIAPPRAPDVIVCCGLFHAVGEPVEFVRDAER
jgi:hypothetical protein